MYQSKNRGMNKNKYSEYDEDELTPNDIQKILKDNLKLSKKVRNYD